MATTKEFRTDELKLIRSILDQYLPLVGISPEVAAEKPVSECVKLALVGLSTALDHITALGQSTATAVGTPWNKNAPLLVNLKNVLNTLQTRVTDTGESALSSSELHTVAATLNEGLPYPFSRLPDNGTEAFRLVAGVLKQNLRS